METTIGAERRDGDFDFHYNRQYRSTIVHYNNSKFDSTSEQAEEKKPLAYAKSIDGHTIPRADESVCYFVWTSLLSEYDGMTVFLRKLVCEYCVHWDIVSCSKTTILAENSDCMWWWKSRHSLNVLCMSHTWIRTGMRAANTAMATAINEILEMLTSSHSLIILSIFGLRQHAIIGT